jgi:type II secretory pathway pseudopilin PulG
MEIDETPPSVGHRRGRLLVVAGMLAILSLGAASAWYVTGPRADAKARSQAHAASVARQEAEQARQATCEDLLSPTYKSLSEINSKLDVGMVERDYTEAVGEARAAYDQIDSAKVDKNSCAAYKDLGDALTQYSKASSYWNDCIVGDYCTPSTTTLNGYWSKSSTNLESVRSEGLGGKSAAATAS